ncbi:MAG: hypothetical protein CL868_04370 [Cytophagaceae bacterium]|nr:hypothetical protein [Cytophagaceae bacterium]|tara:strand:- start:12629 stop:13054 length:426 start_codon:yes stop_codon:yes gene_type:complete
MNKNDKEIERLSHKYLAQLEPEDPSLDFSVKILAKIESMEQRKVDATFFQYKPLITTRGWVAVFGIFIAALGVILYYNAGFDDIHVNSDWMSAISHKLDGFQLPQIPKVPYGAAMVMIFLTVLASVEMYFIKRFFDKKFNL